MSRTSVLQDIASYLGTALAAAYPGLLIVEGDLPATPLSLLLCVGKYSGAPADLGFNTPGIKYEHPGIQLLARGAPKDLASPENLCDDAYQALAGMQCVVVNGTQYQLAHPQQAPFKRETDSNNCHVFAVNFILDKVPS